MAFFEIVYAIYQKKNKLLLIILKYASVNYFINLKNLKIFIYIFFALVNDKENFLA